MRIAILAALAGACIAGPALALDKVTFATNWLADPEAGGYYQAVVDGTYAKYGLDVTIMQGGPQSNGGMLLVAGKIEFFMGGDMIGDFLAVEQDIPDRSPSPLTSRKIRRSSCRIPASGWTSGPTCPRPPRSSARARLGTFYAWMRLAWGFKDENVKPYNFNSAPFIVDKNSIQQGYVTSEPLRGGKAGRLQAQCLPALRPGLLDLCDH